MKLSEYKDVCEKPIRWIKPPAELGEGPFLKTSSFSRQMVWKQCQRHAFLKFGMKIPEPERQGEDPRDRGSRLHQHEEDFIQGEVPELDKEVKYFRKEAETYRDIFASNPEQMKIEERWNFDLDWNRVGDQDWGNIRFITKLDLLHLKDEFTADFIDWKSGKKHNNEVKHTEQLITYAVNTFQSFPELEELYGAMYYIDKNETLGYTFKRASTMRQLRRIDKKITEQVCAKSFPPSPSMSHCRFCPYKTGQITKGVEGTGHCDDNP